MSDKTFETICEFLTHLRMEVGDTLTFPLSPPKADGSSTGWYVKVTHEGAGLYSVWYNVVPDGAYSAATIKGHLINFGGQQATGMVEFGIGDDGRFKTLNRRGLNSKSVFPDGRMLVVVTANANPDRLSGEPVAVIIDPELKHEVIDLSADARLEVFMRLRDGLEMEAFRRVLIWADAE